MPPKRPSSEVADPGSGRMKQKVMTLGEEIKLLNDLETGLSLAEIGRRHGVNESAVRQGKTKDCWVQCNCRSGQALEKDGGTGRTGREPWEP